MSSGPSVQRSSLGRFGGPRVRLAPMPSRMAFGASEFEAVRAVFEESQRRGVDFGYQEDFERRYTDAFVQYLGTDGFADAVCSGTAALYIAVAALQLPAGSHVLVSSITDPGSINAIILNNLVPVLVDSMPDSYNIGPEQLEQRITEKSKAIMVVHAAGRAAPVDEITRIAHERGLLVIEDCSQSHGARLHRRQVGTFGDIAAFSTMYRKNHTTGGCGGVVFTPNEELYRLVRAYADRGKPFWYPDYQPNDPGQFLFPALNLNLDEISCAIGLASLGRLDQTIKQRVKFVQQLNQSLVQNSTVCRPSPVSEDDSPFFHIVFVDQQRICCSKEEFAAALINEGIIINPHYRYVVSEWPYVKPYLTDSFECPNAKSCRDRSFNILLNENYGEEEVKDITAAIVKVEGYFAV